jgi:hypothetical protein
MIGLHVWFFPAARVFRAAGQVQDVQDVPALPVPAMATR